MTETCEWCEKEYIPHSDLILVFKTCSNVCRSILYSRMKDTKKIDNGNFDSFKVSKIKDLGYCVTVSRIGFGGKK